MENVSPSKLISKGGQKPSKAKASISEGEVEWGLYYVDDLLDALESNEELSRSDMLRIKHFAEILDRFGTLARRRLHLRPFTFPKTFKLSELSPRFRANKALLVLDLDETLIHCNARPLSERAVRLSSGRGDEIFLHLRPKLEEFLQRMGRVFTMVVYTASSQKYADFVLDFLERRGKVFSLRLYRQHCLPTPEGEVLKDLGIISDFDPRQTVFVDNSPDCFFRNWENGVPILPFVGSRSDCELLKLARFLEKISRVADFRAPLERSFRLGRLALGSPVDPHNFYKRS